MSREELGPGSNVSQETEHVSLIKVTPISGKATLGTWWCHGQRGARAQNREYADVGDGTKL